MNMNNVGRGGVSSTETEQTVLQSMNKRLTDIRLDYEDHLKTPQQRREEDNGSIEQLLRKCPGLAQYGSVFQSLQPTDEDEDPRGKIFSVTFDYNNGKEIKPVTITSESHRHWRQATIHDVGSIVFLCNSMESDSKLKFGEFEDIDDEPDEEFPDEQHTVAQVMTFGGTMETEWAQYGKFEDLLVVPEEILSGKAEAPPGKFFSGISKSGNNWSPAPTGQTWMEHPFLTNPSGMYLNDAAAYFTAKRIHACGMKKHIMLKSWLEIGQFAYWDPVFERFITEPERLKLEHWFHNGDGTPSQRYFYTQREMLDKHGGMSALPTAVDRRGNAEEVSVVNEVSVEEAVSRRVMEAAARGEVIDLSGDT
ncbi:hypothetical protein ACHAWF_005068 [Thalassiosira exigua]